MPARLVRWALPVAVAVVTLSFAACGGAGESATPQPSTTTTAVAADGFEMDWTAAFETRVPNGWVIRDCEGDRLNVCVYDGDRFVGDIELNPDYPLDRGDVGKDARQVARKLAGDMIDHFRGDRAEGCAAFTFNAEPVTDATVGARPGARGGFTLTDSEGRVVERVINYYLVAGDAFAIVNADAYVEEGGCLGPTEYDPTFTPADLDKLEPYLDQLVAATPTSVTRDRT